MSEFRRGRGITIAASPQRSAVIEQARELVRLARASGYTRDELVGIVEHAASCPGDDGTARGRVVV